MGIKAGGPAGTTLDNFAAGAVPSTGALPFADQFETATAQQLDSGKWEETNGNFKVAGGTASNATAALSVARLRGVNSASQYAEADIDLAAGSDRVAGLLTQYSDIGYYRLDVVAAATGTTATLYAYTASGTQEQLGTATVSGTGLAADGDQERLAEGLLQQHAAVHLLRHDGGHGGSVGIKAGGPAGTTIDNFMAGDLLP